jgi:hypothetical protein
MRACGSGISVGSLTRRVRRGGKAERLKTLIPRELDLTYLNHKRFGEVHKMMEREFSSNELRNCRRSIPDRLGLATAD